MELRNLYTFLRVAELGSFTKAAEDLGYAQSTVTTQIQQLEEEVGKPLFDRIGRRVTLTAHGQEMIEYVNEMLRVEQKIRRIGNTQPEQLGGSIRIGAVESVMNSVLLALIQEYRKRYPQVFIQVFPSVSSTLFDMLRHNEVDVIFTLGTISGPKDCVCAASHPERAVFITAPEHPLARREQVGVDEILSHPMILNAENAFLQQELSRLAQRRGREITGNIQAESSSMIVSLTKKNLGIAFLGEYLIRSTVEKEKLRILPVQDYTLTFYTNIFYHRNKWETPQMLGLVQLAKEYWEAPDQNMPGGH